VFSITISFYRPFSATIGPKIVHLLYINVVGTPGMIMLPRIPLKACYL
jgi:hypothetical protein